MQQLGQEVDETGNSHVDVNIKNNLESLYGGIYSFLLVL